MPSSGHKHIHSHPGRKSARCLLCCAGRAAALAFQNPDAKNKPDRVFSIFVTSQNRDHIMATTFSGWSACGLGDSGLGCNPRATWKPADVSRKPRQSISLFPCPYFQEEHHMRTAQNCGVCYLARILSCEQLDLRNFEKLSPGFALQR